MSRLRLLFIWSLVYLIEWACKLVIWVVMNFSHALKGKGFLIQLCYVLGFWAIGHWVAQSVVVAFEHLVEFDRL